MSSVATSRNANPSVIVERTNEIWRKYGISSATYYKWKAKYGGLEASDIKRLKELEHEDSKLKRFYADMALEHAALKDLSEKKL